MSVESEWHVSNSSEVSWSSDDHRLIRRMDRGRHRRTAVAMWPMLVAVGCFASAMIAPPIPIWFAGAMAVAALLRVRPTSIAVSLILLTGSFASQAQLGSRQLSPGRFEGIVQLTADPDSTDSSIAVDVRSALGRLRMVAHGTATAGIRSLSAGDRIRVSGRIESGRFRDASRHLRGNLIVGSATSRISRTPFIEAIESLRSVIIRGAAVLPDQLRPLYLGFVIGDDRGSAPVVEADLEAAGLGHLTVVSGENLAFVLLVASPLLRRVALRRRFLLIALLLVVFAALTRLEPSVLRATVMASVIAATIRAGRPASPLRTLCLAVIVIVIVDPLIVWSLGFRLSLSATLGIIVLAPPISRRIPGHRRLARAIAVPVAAQIGVAPVSIPVFGPQPLLAVPANVLAAPAAAFVMMWGCTAGVVAGLLGDGVAGILHRPTALGLQWVVFVASIVASLPPITVGLLAASTATAVGIASAVVRGRARAVLAIVCVMTLLLPLLAGPTGTSPLVGERLGGARVWISGGSDRSVVVLLGGGVDIAQLLGELRSRGVRRIDLLVRASAVSSAVGAQRALLAALSVGHTVSVDDPIQSPADQVETSEIGTLAVTIRRVGPRLEIDVAAASEPDPLTGGG